MNELDNQIMSTKALKASKHGQEPRHHHIINAKIIEIKIKNTKILSHSYIEVLR